MPVTVPDAVGILHYNGFTFPATTSVVPRKRTVVSEDGTTYQYSEYRVVADCLVSCEDTYEAIAAGSTTDTLMTYLTKVFAKVGGTFGFINWGFGSIVLNGAVTTTDKIPPSNEANVRTPATYATTHVPIEEGPVVHLDECSFTGFNKSLKLKVTFEFRIYDAVDAAVWTADNRKMIEMTLQRSWTVNQAGYLSRVTKGHVRYWVVFNDNGATFINQEFNFIAQYVVPAIPSYQREQSYDPDVDNRGFTFTISDIPTESPLPFVAPIRKMELVHSVQSGLTSQQGFFNRWKVLFNVEVECMQDRSKTECFPIIGQIILERMQNLFGALSVDGTQLVAKAINNKHMLMSMGIVDTVTSNKFSLDMEWLCTFRLDQLLTASKILSRPSAAVQNNWNAWSQAMIGIQGVSAPNFILQTEHRPVSASSAEQTPKRVYDQFVPPQAPGYSTPELSGPPPNSGIQGPFDNYSHFSARHRIESDSQTRTAPKGFNSSGSGYSPRDGASTSGGLAPPSAGVASPSTNAYRIGPTQNTYALYGQAERVGGVPAIPTLATYDGVILAEVGKSAVELTQYTISGGIPVYRVMWYMSYALPAEIPPGTNPYSKLNLTLSEGTVYGGS